MSTHERKVRKRAGIKFSRVTPKARSLSAEEYEEVLRFGIHEELVDDVQGMTFGVRLASTALLIVVALVVLVAVGLILLDVIL